MQVLEEELRIITLRNRFLGRPNKIEEEIKLRRKTKKKIDNIEKLKEAIREDEFESDKKLEDLNYAKHDEMVEIAKLELKLERSRASRNINCLFKKIIYSEEIFTSCFTDKNT